jgi:activator of HSP90 ATPase
MINTRNLEAVHNGPTRRWVVAAAGIAVGRMMAGAALGAVSPRRNMKEVQTSAADKARTSLHQEIDFNVGPATVYEALLDSKQFGMATGLPAEIDPKAGGAFKTFGGLIEGRNVELVSNVRIVQAWRPGHWDPGVYSIVRFELKSKDSGSVVILDHTGFPEGDYASLNEGWKTRYWNPFAKFFDS